MMIIDSPLFFSLQYFNTMEQRNRKSHISRLVSFRFVLFRFDFVSFGFVTATSRGIPLCMLWIFIIFLLKSFFVFNKPYFHWLLSETKLKHVKCYWPDIYLLIHYISFLISTLSEIERSEKQRKSWIFIYQ